MASAIKKVNKISQIVRLKQVVQRWRHISLKRRSALSDSDSDGFESDGRTGVGGRGRVTPPGCLAVYAGPERRRFVIPTRYLNLSIFVSLLNQAEEEFGFQISGGLVLPCDADFFEGVLKFLDRDEQRYGVLGLDDFFRMFSGVLFDSGKETAIDSAHGFTPLLQKTRV